MHFGLKKSDFQKCSKIPSRHVWLSKNIFWVPESRLGPPGTIQIPLEVILAKVEKWCFEAHFGLFLHLYVPTEWFVLAVLLTIWEFPFLSGGFQWIFFIPSKGFHKPPNDYANHIKWLFWSFETCLRHIRVHWVVENYFLGLNYWKLSFENE